MKRYTSLREVGTGSFGVVYRAIDSRTNEHVAIKQIKIDRKEGVPPTSIREISILKSLDHRNIVRFKSVFIEGGLVNLILEYVDNDLYNYMRTFGDEGMSLVQVKSCMFQILCGIAFCHSCGILHRDLKPQNILVDQRTGNLKLADFGLSRAFGLPLRKYSREVVTLWYRPPEILLAASRYTTSVDIWSAGCIFAEMLNYQALFKGQSEIEQLFKIFSILGTPTEASFSECKALPNYSEEFPKWLPRSMNQWCPKLNECPAGQILLLSMLDYQADSRITARAALEDPYFTS